VGRTISPKKGINLSRILAHLKGKWVALSSDEKRVVGKGITLEKALEQARESGEEDPILIKVPKVPGDYFF
jgi:hypothetical protein